jgi:hypothetical protein
MKQLAGNCSNTPKSWNYLGHLTIKFEKGYHDSLNLHCTNFIAKTMPILVNWASNLQVLVIMAHSDFDHEFEANKASHNATRVQL